ncbi:MAG TPA: S41 family peptidase [Gemmatimonadaceae bacterium]|nr:S41 family peptidase [Gemmatimonadaceae bacterium]
MPRFARTFAVGLLAVVSRVGDGVAQSPPPALDAASRRELIDSVTAQVERLYVDPDTGRMIANALRTRLHAGAYDTIADPRRLSVIVTADLRSINNDLHLAMVYAPNGGLSPFSSAMALAERQRHYGLGRLEVLPGNVGYMEVTGFAGAPEASGLVAAALRYLETTDAIIIDLRKNNGGSPALANLIASHFVGPDTIPTVTSRVRGLEPGSMRTVTQYTLATVPGPRRTDVPLYVLTSRGTASAGEWFSFTLQNLKRATLVGDRTAGAGHNVTFVQSGFGFSTTISYSRVADARTGKEWEQVGVHPDVAVAPAAALDVAHLAALDVIAASASDVRKRELTRIRDAVQARRDSAGRP